MKELLKLMPLWQHLKNTKKPIILYGMGNGADKIIDYATSQNIKISGVFASDNFASYKTFRGMTVKKFADIQNEFQDFVVLVSFGTQLPEVMANIKKISGICETYAPDMSVYGNEVFTFEYFSENFEKFERIYNILADETSKHTFKNIIAYKLTGEIPYLTACETPESEVYQNIIIFNEDEVFADVGAYRGDTVEKFINMQKNYKHIYAFEPDERSFKKLVVSTKNLDNFTAFNVAAHSKKGQTVFGGNFGRGASVFKDGKQISCDTLDNLCNITPTFIKIDAEGLESDVLMGAQKIIKIRPKMLVSAYHKAADLLEIPHIVMSINGDYKLYLRHHPYIPAWDTNYFFI